MELGVCFPLASLWLGTVESVSEIDSVASSVITGSARDMIEALIAGERDPRVSGTRGCWLTWPAV